MNEEPTQDIPDSHSFEERVFLRFDALDSRLRRMESRLENVEARLDNVGSRDISRKFSVMSNDMIQLRADQTHLETRLSNLESKFQE